MADENLSISADVLNGGAALQDAISDAKNAESASKEAPAQETEDTNTETNETETVATDTETPSETNEPDFAKVFEKEGIPFKSIAELKEYREAQETYKTTIESKIAELEKRPVIDDEMVLKFKDFRSNFKDRDPKLFFDITEKDFDALSPRDRIKQDMLLNNKEGLTHSEIDLILDNDYQKKDLPEITDPTDADEKKAYDEAVKYNSLVDIRIKRDAAKASENLNTLKNQFKIVSADTQKAEQLAFQETLNNATTEYVKHLDKNVTKLKHEVVIDDKGTKVDVNLTVTPEDRAFCAEVFKNSKGNLGDSKDINEFTDKMVTYRNMNKLLTAAVKQGMATQEEIRIKNKSNPDYNGKKPNFKQETESKSITKEAQELIFGN